MKITDDMLERAETALWYLRACGGFEGEFETLHTILQEAARHITPDREAIRIGYALVPIKPTENMVVAGFESWPDEFFSDPDEWATFEKMTGCQQAAHKARLCYAAMIAAAPEQIPTPSPRDTLIEEIAEMVDHMGEGRRLEEYVGAIREMKGGKS
ncbi:hypothetical protein [Burkholderia vietnamiensis]|uniref:hypothetical protein n=1 Tax=Burkholderia vietnamiensis TaxID=60552 RepID=UPI001CF4819E|nr:hypothetical protein [Burkholderia vietnamiensis]MCA8073153.1 hypothetical protein [Burkholderia vietnamiensis]